MRSFQIEQEMAFLLNDESWLSQMSISGTEQAAQGKRTLSPFLATKAVFYAAILITIRRADHFQVKVHVLKTFFINFIFLGFWAFWERSEP